MFEALWFGFFTWLELTRKSDRKSCAHWRRETVRTRSWRKWRLPSLLIGWFSVVRCGRSQNPTNIKFSTFPELSIKKHEAGLHLPPSIGEYYWIQSMTSWQVHHFRCSDKVGIGENPRSPWTFQLHTRCTWCCEGQSRNQLHNRLKKPAQCHKFSRKKLRFKRKKYFQKAFIVIWHSCHVVTCHDIWKTWKYFRQHKRCLCFKHKHLF